MQTQQARSRWLQVGRARGTTHRAARDRTRIHSRPAPRRPPVSSPSATPRISPTAIYTVPLSTAVTDNKRITQYALDTSVGLALFSRVA